MFAAVFLRSILSYQTSPLLGSILILLSGVLLAFMGSTLLANKSPWFQALLIGLEVLVILRLLILTRTDYFAFLFAIQSMQVMQQFTSRGAAVLIGLTTLLTFMALYQQFGIFYTLAIVVVFFGGSVFLVTYIGATRRASLIEEQQQELVAELEQSNRQIESYSRKLQQLVAGRERQHLARDLHDSVTQTIFSMTLTTQSALMLMERDPQKVATQLDRLVQLGISALSEMQVLISELAPEPRTSEGFLASLRQHLTERKRLDNLMVSLDVEGNQFLTPAEETSLFRITQEALNNIVKHAGVTRAAIHLHLDSQPRLEIEDEGTGFDSQKPIGSGQVGLVSMQERALEIGWRLRVDSSPGNGTRIRVEKVSGGVKQP